MGNLLDSQRVWKGLTPKAKKRFFEIKDKGTLADGRIYDGEGNDVSDYVEVNVKTHGRANEGYRITRHMEGHDAENGGFTWAFYTTCRTFLDEYTGIKEPDIARLMYIATYVGFQNQQLAHDNGRKIDKTGLRNLLGLSANKFRDFYKRVTEADILNEKDNVIEISPLLFYRGKVRGKDAEISRIKLYRKTVRELYTNFGGRAAKKLSIIYMVLPFLNLKTNVVCFNPDETDTERLNKMHLDKLAALLGYRDSNKLRQTLESVKLNGKPVFWLPPDPNDRRKKMVIVNPNVVYGGPAKELDAIKVLFK
ncbi:hypothetical protein P5667_15395 [Bacillus velezensis]|uniref:hypothetical protein n=1 Tax=Bacillus velezensis TaxID=492670 RepID=UPI0027A25D2B|nr:hypothetical protein [Bacillus velezensis]WEY80357.1 hypothetical protein P5667_15395 [Bacillus velezensis]